MFKVGDIVAIDDEPGNRFVILATFEDGNISLAWLQWVGGYGFNTVAFHRLSLAE